METGKILLKIIAIRSTDGFYKGKKPREYRLVSNGASFSFAQATLPLSLLLKGRTGNCSFLLQIAGSSF